MPSPPDEVREFRIPLYRLSRGGHNLDLARETNGFPMLRKVVREQRGAGSLGAKYPPASNPPLHGPALGKVGAQTQNRLRFDLRNTGLM